MRMTRAALRAQESEESLKADLDVQLKKQGITETSGLDIAIREDSDLSCDDRSSKEDSPERQALRDITEDNYPTVDDVEQPVLTEVVPKKPAAKKTKKSKAKAGKKKDKPVTEQAEDAVPDAEVETPVDTMTVSSPVEDAETDNQIRTDEVPVSPEPTCQPEYISHESATALPPNEDPPAASMSTSTEQQTGDQTDTLFNHDSHVSKTPKFNPEIHITAEPSQVEVDDEDSFVDSIKTRSPSKINASQTEAYLVSSTPSRTPSRAWSSPRVEDSVAALDELEDALEKVSDDFSALDAMQLESPSKRRRSPVQTPSKAIGKPFLESSATKLTRSASNKVVVKSPSAQIEKVQPSSIVKERVKAIESRPAAPVHRRAVSIAVVKKEVPATSRPIGSSRHAPSKSVTSITMSKQDLSFSNSPAKQQPAYLKKRVTSGALVTSKPAFVPIKSTKPPTKSSFTLPGEATAARLKAQREERQKREEEAAGKKKEFKARPAPSRTVRPSVMPKENKASQARSNAMSKQQSGESEDKENVAPASRSATTRPLSMNLKTKSEVNKAGSTSTSNKPGVTRANSTARRTTTAAGTNGVNRTAITSTKPLTTTTTTLNASRAAQKTATAAPQSAPSTALVSASTATVATKSSAKGKEVLMRHRQTLEDSQRERKEKEEAAKKARAEAAERGRQASREWAEKQKKRMLADKEAKMHKISLEHQREGESVVAS